MRREDRQEILKVAHHRVMASVLQKCAADPNALSELLAESVYQHAIQMQLHAQVDKAYEQDESFWYSVRRRLGKGGLGAAQQLLGEVIGHYLDDICGHFNYQVYRLVSQVAPAALAVLLNASSPKRLLTGGYPTSLHESIVLQGEVQTLCRLHRRGSVVLAATHASHLDALVLGFALNQLQLPPFVYGANREMYNNRLLRFFLHYLGVYRVDRRNQDNLYKQVLKAFSSLVLEFGYSSIVFPSGSRTRSGMVDSKLKLGLLGTTLTAYIYNLQAERAKAKVFVMPVSLSYQLVLEAETLIDDFLRDVGASRYIITDDEFSRPDRIFDFVTKLFGLDSKIYVTFGQPLDPLGNRVDDLGESLDPKGRRIDLSLFVRNERGEVGFEHKRDRYYSQELGAALQQAYIRDNVVQSTHVLCFVLFQLLRQKMPQQDTIRLCRIGATVRASGFDQAMVYAVIERVLQHLQQLAQQQRLRLAVNLVGSDLAVVAEEVVAHGLRHLQAYHRQPAARRLGDKIVLGLPSLLYYYQNRLQGYGLEQWCILPL